MPLTYRASHPPTHLYAKDQSTSELVARAASAGCGPGGSQPPLRLHSELPIAGQGTLCITMTAVGPFQVLFTASEDLDAGEALVLAVGDEVTTFYRRRPGQPDVIIGSTTRPSALVVKNGKPVTYWVSLDTNNRRLRFGKGQMLPRLCVFQVGLDPAATGAPDPYGFLRALRCLWLAGAPVLQADALLVWPVPVTVDVAALVVPDDALTLEDISRCEATVSAGLPPAARELYGMVAGAGINLAPADFPDFAAAIEESINTPGRWCFQRLKEKGVDSQFHNPKNAYLRITLGENQGNSPGAPFVVEIWPSGHGSPIHDHGQACAVIKVLHGVIRVDLFAGLKHNLQGAFATADFRAGQVTFLSPEFYQVHRLRNLQPGGKMTVTIQCYRYSPDDSEHYEFFNYLNGNGVPEKFTPDSDCSYLTFKRIVKEEWETARAAEANNH